MITASTFCVLQIQVQIKRQIMRCQVQLAEDFEEKYTPWMSGFLQQNRNAGVWIYYKTLFYKCIHVLVYIIILIILVNLFYRL